MDAKTQKAELTRAAIVGAAMDLAAAEGLDITTIIFANNSYAILKAEYSNMGAGTPGERALSMIDIDRPRIDWLAMAQSMGVPAMAVETAEGFHRALVDSAREPGPRLIEVRLYRLI